MKGKLSFFLIVPVGAIAMHPKATLAALAWRSMMHGLGRNVDLVLRLRVSAMCGRDRRALLLATHHGAYLESQDKSRRFRTPMHAYD